MALASACCPSRDRMGRYSTLRTCSQVPLRTRRQASCALNEMCISVPQPRLTVVLHTHHPSCDRGRTEFECSSVAAPDCRSMTNTSALCALKARPNARIVEVVSKARNSACTSSDGLDHCKDVHTLPSSCPQHQTWLGLLLQGKVRGGERTQTRPQSTWVRRPERACSCTQSSCIHKRPRRMEPPPMQRHVQVMRARSHTSYCTVWRARARWQPPTRPHTAVQHTDLIPRAALQLLYYHSTRTSTPPLSCSAACSSAPVSSGSSPPWSRKSPVRPRTSIRCRRGIRIKCGVSARAPAAPRT